MFANRRAGRCSGSLVHVTTALQPLLPKKAGPARAEKIPQVHMWGGTEDRVPATCMISPRARPGGESLNPKSLAAGRRQEESGPSERRGGGQARSTPLCILGRNLRVLAQHPVASEFLASCLVSLSM